ncbi:MAG: DUF1573 domain-containing protein [Phycisphaerales bacterium]
MQRSLIRLALLALPLIAITCGAQTPPATNQPAARPAQPAQQAPQSTPQFPTGPVVAEPAKIDLGLVKPDELVTATFKLINPLDHDVVVVQAATSCQCTGVDIQGKKIPARGSIDMPVSMKMSKAPIKKMASVTMVIDIGLDNGAKQPLKVEIAAEVAYPIRATPGYIDALAPERMQGTFTLAAVDGKPFRVVSVQGNAPAFVNFDPTKDQPASSYALRYDFTAPNFVVPKYLIVETDRPDCPLVDLRVRHETTRISPPFKVAEFRSTFGSVASGQTGTFDLELEEVGSNRVTSVRSLSPQFAVTMTDQKADGKNLLLTCSVTPAAGAKGLLNGLVEIRVGSKSYEHVLYGTVH